MIDWEAFEHWIDDNSPELSRLSRAELMQTAEYKSFARNAASASRPAVGRRATGTRKAPAGKASQKNLKGSVAQKKWAAEIRAAFIAKYSETFPDAVRVAAEMESAAKVWIEHRMAPADLGRKIEDAISAQSAAKAALDAGFDARGIRPGQSFTADAELSRLLDTLYRAQKTLRTLLAG